MLRCSGKPTCRVCVELVATQGTSLLGFRPQGGTGGLGLRVALFHAVDYDFPADRPVSDSVKSLLGRMLVADASQRATLLEIEQHPWFRKDMPPDLDVGTFNASYLRLSDSVEHANSIRRCVSGGLLTALWLWHDAAMSGTHGGRAGTWGEGPHVPWLTLMKVESGATHIAATNARLADLDKSRKRSHARCSKNCKFVCCHHASCGCRVVREALAAAQSSEGYAFEDEYNHGAFSSSSTQYR